MPVKRDMIVVDGGAVGRPFVEVAVGARVDLRVDVPNRGAVRWSLLASPPGSVQSFESDQARETGLRTTANDAANMYVIRLDVDAGKDTWSYDVVVLGVPDDRGWVIPAFPVAGVTGLVQPSLADVAGPLTRQQPPTDPWNVTWGMRRILNDLRGLFGDTGGGDILWQWNAQDMSQFGPALKPSAHFFEWVFAGTPECTVVERAEGNRIRIYVPGTGGDSRGVVYLPIAASEQLALPERYILEYSLIDGIVNGNLYGGAVYYCNGEVPTAEDIRAVVALNTCGGGSFSYQGVISETTFYQGVGAEYQFNATGATPPGGPIPVFVRIEVKGRKPVGDQPGAIINVASHGGQGDGGACYRFDDSVFFPQPWPAGWDALTADDINQAGLVMFANAAIDNPYVEFGHFRILRHPLDM